jgi:hyperosmotically inducible protein
MVRLKKQTTEKGGLNMRSLCSLVCVLLLIGSAAAQDKTAATKQAKPASAAADCSTTDDSKLAADVKEKLAKTPSLKDFSISTSASGGVVTLSGKVKTGANKGTATRVARSVKCVKSIENKLEVEDHTPVRKPNSATGGTNKSSRSKKNANQ